MNEQSQLAKPTTRSRISPEGWEQIKTAHASGIGLREIARNMGIPEGTVRLPDLSLGTQARRREIQKLSNPTGAV
jgi:hypothetical protein